jgi:hypothetical protein
MSRHSFPLLAQCRDLRRREFNLWNATRAANCTFQVTRLEVHSRPEAEFATRGRATADDLKKRFQMLRGSNLGRADKNAVQTPRGS